MLTYGDAPVAWGLARGMARAIGVELVGAVIEGWLDRYELDRLVGVCLGCQAQAGCAAFLAITPRAPAPPDFCPNRTSLAALRG
jgi:hypothetical protein